MPSNPPNAATHPQPVRVRVWDPALRAYHWLLAAAVTVTWLLGQFGPASMTLHFWLGYLILGLLAFRLVWGLVGPAPARFASFVRGPGATLCYARGIFVRQPSLTAGHNPLGALSAVAMIAVLAMQGVTGLFVDPDDYINVGPLAGSVDAATRKLAIRLHHLGATLTVVLVGLHVAAILFYRMWKREDLVRPMLTGWKLVRPPRD